MAAVVFFAGRSSRSGAIKERDQRIQRFREELDRSKIANKSLDQEKQNLQREIDLAENRQEQMKELLAASIGILKHPPTLPPLIRWASRIDEAKDKIEVNGLVYKRRPARKAAKQVKEARAESRRLRKELSELEILLSSYEALAPWLREYTDYSLEDILEFAGDKSDNNQQRDDPNSDPAKRFIPPGEWENLTEVQRDQLALERYLDPSRKRSPHEAGIAYERFIGHQYEKQGYKVHYQGALSGRQDLGIDLVCSLQNQHLIVQCKRLSPAVGSPVRENTVAQVFGAANYWQKAAIDNGDIRKNSLVIPTLVTSFELSEQAREFARLLPVVVVENKSFGSYPAIKCNLNADGDKIYHLPMDQQYDKIDMSRKNTFYAETVSEANRKGYRRAFRWGGTRRGDV